MAISSPIPPRASPGKKGAAIRRIQFHHGILFPAIFILLLVGLFPFIYTLVVSFQDISLMGENRAFQGLLQYKKIFSDPRLWESLGHTLIFMIIALPIELLLGLGLAFLFLERLPGRQIYVALLMLPTMVSPIVAGAIWRVMYDNRYGPINQVLSWFSGEPVTLLWITKPDLVYPAILMAEIWQWTPFMFLILLAALSNVDQSLIESAEIDGASPWRIFFKIVRPSIWPVMSVALLIRSLDLFRIFDVVYALTQGGPGTMTETISIYTYVQGFQQFETSYTAAVSLVIVILLSMVVTFALRRMEAMR